MSSLIDLTRAREDHPSDERSLDDCCVAASSRSTKRIVNQQVALVTVERERERGARGLDRGGRWLAANSSSAINPGGFSHEGLTGV
jgi:hypothetical protein